VTNNTDTCADDNSAADADGFSCYAYTLFPDDCGAYDDDDSPLLKHAVLAKMCLIKMTKLLLLFLAP